jgi:hypothetical protein
VSHLPHAINSGNDLEEGKGGDHGVGLNVVEKRKPAKIRVELNIEKWPGIWQPSKSKNKPKLRAFERTITLEDRSTVTARLEVSFTHLGTLTTEEQRMFYTLIDHWEKSGRPSTEVFFSDRQLARRMGKKWGTNVIESVTKSLRKLRTVPLEFVNSYFDKTNDGRVLRARQAMTFLGDLKIIETAQDGAVNSAKGYFRFDDNLLGNLLAHNTKPLLLDEFFQIKTDIGSLLYTHVDLIMANKYRYERCTKELFEDLGLQNVDYQHMSKRKRALEMPLKEITGLRISTGIISSARIEKTQDKRDYKIVIEKKSVREFTERVEDQRDVAVLVQPNSVERSAAPVIEEQADAVVRYFHKLFHGVGDHRPLSKELSQAVSLIATLGYEKARYVVDFSRQSAERTKYQPQTFGGIMHYQSRAVARYDHVLAGKDRARQSQESEARTSRLEDAYDSYVGRAIDAYVADPKHKEKIARLLRENLAELGHSHPLMRPEARERLAHFSVRSAVKARLAILGFEEFVHAENAQATADSITADDVPDTAPLTSRHGAATSDPAAESVPPMEVAQPDEAVVPGVNVEPAAMPSTPQDGASDREEITIQSATNVTAESLSDILPDTSPSSQIGQ